jgi:hypothetical protein
MREQGTAREIDTYAENLNVKLFRRKGIKNLMAIAVYEFSDPKTIAEIIAFLNSKSTNPILEGYIDMIERLAAEKEAREDCIERLGTRTVL